MPKRIFAVLYVSVVTKRQFFTFMLLITEMIWFAVVLPSCIKATTRCSIGTAWSFVRGDEITKGITEKLSKTLRCCATATVPLLVRKKISLCKYYIMAFSGGKLFAKVAEYLHGAERLRIDHGLSSASSRTAAATRLFLSHLATTSATLI